MPREQPQYLELYDSFPKEIYRADFMRPILMHAFGGIYADLDLLPLSKLDSHLLFDERTSPAGAWLGSMWVGDSTEEVMRYSIPNAFLASSGPHHPFWHHYIEDIAFHWRAGDIDRDEVESATGPVALWRAKTSWTDMDNNAILHVLPNDRIYPFSWDSKNHGEKCVCLAGRDPAFNPSRCDRLYPNAWTITCGLSSFPIICTAGIDRQEQIGSPGGCNCMIFVHVFSISFPQCICSFKPSRDLDRQHI